EHARGTAQHFCGSAEAKLFRVGRGDGRNDTRRTVGAPAPPFHSSGKRFEHGTAHSRNHSASTPNLPQPDIHYPAVVASRLNDGRRHCERTGVRSGKKHEEPFKMRRRNGEEGSTALDFTVECE